MGGILWILVIAWEYTLVKAPSLASAIIQIFPSLNWLALRKRYRTNCVFDFFFLTFNRDEFTFTLSCWMCNGVFTNGEIQVYWLISTRILVLAHILEIIIFSPLVYRNWVGSDIPRGCITWEEDAMLTSWILAERSETNYDPIPPLAQSIALESKLLCFDEFQVTGKDIVILAPLIYI